MFWEIILELSEGFLITCEIFALTLIFALPLGLLVALGAMSRFKPLKAVVKTIVWIVRGTPLMLQIMVIYYGPGLLFGVRGIGNMLAVMIAFILNYACYFSEIYRGGIESISKGQYEAGQVLGMTRSQIFFKVVLLQVVKRRNRNSFCCGNLCVAGNHLAAVLHRGLLFTFHRHSDDRIRQTGKETQLFQGVIVWRFSN